MNADNFINSSIFLFDRFWSMLGSIQIFNSISLRDLIISFLILYTIFRFAFNHVMRTGD